MKDICEATQLSGEEELEVSQKSSPTRPFLDQRIFFLEKKLDERVLVFYQSIDSNSGLVNLIEELKRESNC